MRVALALVVVLLATGCGGGDGKLEVFAASSLRDVLPRIDGRAEYAFGGSDALARQIREGADADVFVSASFGLAHALYRDQIVMRPLVVARNRLVIAVPRANTAHVRSLDDLARRDVKVVLADAGVPAGDYAAQALRLGGVHAHVVSYEDDVRGVLAKVALGEADAGIVYATDVRAASRDVHVIGIAHRLQPPIVYAAAVVTRGDRDAASDYVARLRSRPGRRELAAAGFATP